MNPDGSEMLTLNPVGTCVWEALENEVDIAALTDDVLGRVTGAPRERVSGDVTAFLAELLRLKLVVECPPLPG